MSRLIAVGDIHGEFDKLVQVMDSVRPTADDTFVFLGDYVDRGPKITETLDYLMDFQHRFPNTICLMGNHEAMMLHFWTDMADGNPEAKVWEDNGGRFTFDQLRNSQYGIGPYIHWAYKELKLFHVVETEAQTYYFSHAGWDIFQPLSTQIEKPDEDILLLTRSHLQHPRSPKYHWKDGVAVFGHTPFKVPFTSKWGIGLDTGAVFAGYKGAGGYLTAAELPTQPEQSIVFHYSHGKSK